MSDFIALLGCESLGENALPGQEWMGLDGPTGTWISRWELHTPKSPNSVVVLAYLLIEEEIVGDLIMNEEDRLRLPLPHEAPTTWKYEHPDCRVEVQTTCYITQIWHIDWLHAVVNN